MFVKWITEVTETKVMRFHQVDFRGRKKGNCAKPHEGKGQRGNYLGQPYNTRSQTSEVLMLVFLCLLSLLASMVVDGGDAKGCGCDLKI